MKLLKILFFGPSQVFFSRHSPQIGTNPNILSLLSLKKGSKLISLRWPLLVLPYYCVLGSHFCLALSSAGSSDLVRHVRIKWIWSRLLNFKRANYLFASWVLIKSNKSESKCICYLKVKSQKANTFAPLSLISIMKWDS